MNGIETLIEIRKAGWDHPGHHVQHIDRAWRKYNARSPLSRRNRLRHQAVDHAWSAFGGRCDPTRVGSQDQSFGRSVGCARLGCAPDRQYQSLHRSNVHRLGQDPRWAELYLPPDREIPRPLYVRRALPISIAFSRLVHRPVDQMRWPNSFRSCLQTFPIPIVIVQHMPPIFTRILAERLTAASHIKVQEGRQGELLRPGMGYIAPGDFHMTVHRSHGAEARS